MDEMIAEIRGMHFRLSDPINPSPAKLLVEVLQGGSELILVREPENAYDPLALQVWIEPRVLGSRAEPVGESDDEATRALKEEFEFRLSGYGWTLEMLRACPQLMLGFVGKEWAELLSPRIDSGAEPTAKFTVTGKGKPAAKITFPEKH